MRDGTCIVSGCQRTRIIARGLCMAHYTEFRRAGTLGDYPPEKFGPDTLQKMSRAKKGRRLSEDHRAALSVAQTGKTPSLEARAKLAAANLGKKRNRGPLTEKQRLHLIKARAAKGPTRLELALRTVLDSLGLEFFEQFPIGNHTVDAYVPKIRMVVEADGSYWHRSEAKERSRDAYLLRNDLVRSVIHLTEQQLKPWTPTDRWSATYRTLR